MVKSSQKKKAANTTKPLNQNILSKPLPYLLVIFLVNIIIFSKTSNFDFVNIDDELLIIENPIITNPNIPYTESFKSKVFGPHYKPITFVTWKFQYNIWGDNPAPYHTLNWILHLLNSLILFVIGIKLFQVIYTDKKATYLSAFLVALLFSINPLRIESVAWATERKDVLFGFFFLLSWLSYILFLERKKYVFLLIGAILYLFSGLSKSMGLTLMMVIFLTDFWFNRKFVWKSIIEKVPYFIAFIGMAYLFGLFDKSQAQAAGTIVNFAEESGKLTSVELVNDLPVYLQWLLSASLRFWLWIVHTFIPIQLSLSYSADSIFGFFSYGLFLFPFLVVGILYFAWKHKEKHPLLLGGILFFGLTISPILTFTESGQGAFLSDRYTYIPSIGLFLILVYFINDWKTQSSNKILILGGLVLFHFTVSLLNVNHWQNSETLFTQVLKVNPTSTLGHLNLGQYYRVTNNYPKAIEIYSKGIKFNPEYPNLYTNRGKIYFDQNTLDFALSDFNKSISLNPNNPEALANRGACFAKQQNWERCFEDLNKALEIDPNNLTANLNRYVAYDKMGNYPKAIESIQVYLSLKPDNAQMWYESARIKRLMDLPQESIPDYSQAIYLDGNNPYYYYERSKAYATIGDVERAKADLTICLQMGYTQVDPGYRQFLGL